MKNYTLKQVSEICRLHLQDIPNCKNCEFLKPNGYCFWEKQNLTPADWSIDDDEQQETRE